jgi:hypothetical protein
MVDSKQAKQNISEQHPILDFKMYLTLAVSPIIKDVL